MTTLDFKNILQAARICGTYFPVTSSPSLYHTFRGLGVFSENRFNPTTLFIAIPKDFKTSVSADYFRDYCFEYLRRVVSLSDNVFYIRLDPAGYFLYRRGLVHDTHFDERVYSDLSKTEITARYRTEMLAYTPSYNTINYHVLYYQPSKPIGTRYYIISNRKIEAVLYRRPCLLEQTDHLALFYGVPGMYPSSHYSSDEIIIKRNAARLNNTDLRYAANLKHQLIGG